MNYGSPRTTSTTPPTTLRTRRTQSRNVDSDVGGARRDTASPNLQSLLDNPSSRAPSPIPKRHPSRPITAIHDPFKPLGTARPTNSRVDRGTAPNSSSGFWEAPWSSIQGLASQFLSSGDASTQATTPRPPARKRRPLAATQDSATSPPPAQWGPSGTGAKELGKGSKEDRLAQVQSKRREGLLAANGHILPDSSGHFKRRDSNEGQNTSIPPSEVEDRDMLVYLHRVTPEDTLAGVMIKYNCQPNIFRKTNRLWPNDNIQIRKIVMLPVEACGVRGRKLPDREAPDLLTETLDDDDFMPTPTAHNKQPSWDTLRKAPDNHDPDFQPPSSSIASSSPSISITSPEGTSEPPWKHDSWVQIDNFVSAVEIARLPRRTLGFFPRSRRKSSDLDTPYSIPSSLDLPRLSYQENTSSPRRPNSGNIRNNKSRSSSHSATHNFHLHGPGGVGTLGKDVRGPGPAPDGLNKFFAGRLPNVAPRGSFESGRSNASSSAAATTGIEHVGGVVEGWVRKMATRAVKSVQPPASSSRDREREAGRGDVIELMDAGDPDVGGDGGKGRMEEEERVLLEERFPPRGRVFEESSARKKR
ncbi:MAG: hypothetical protein Q9220_007168 [cf. Caloplaca sp. 1 TL-2023]